MIRSFRNLGVPDFTPRRRTVLPTAFLICAAALGCSSEPQRSSLHGKVTFDGKPVVHGTLNLIPDRSKGNKGEFGVAEIKDGVYQTNPGYGFTPGPVLATFTIYDAPPPNNKMIANVQDFAVVIPDGTAEYDFKLGTKDVKEHRP